MSATVKSLLPPNASKLERVLEQATSRVGAVPISLRPLWNARTCPVKLLPWLAYQLGVDEWDNNWPEAYKRDVIESAREVRRKKGTPGAIKRALAALGHPNAVLVERQASIRHNGQAKRNGTRSRGGPGQWATFGVILTRPISIAQGDLIRRRIASDKRNCCHLTYLDFTSAPNLHNGMILRDGTYTHGLV